jgi:PBSX family phage terminase large subunit
MSSATDLVITPHDGQVTVLTTPKRFILALAGIQGGKTFIGCVWLQLEIQKNPKGTHLVCALSKEQLDNVVIRKFFELFPSYKQYYTSTDRKITLPTGGVVVFKSLDDPKYVEGITAHSAWIDEADLITYTAYLVVRGRVNATGGRILMTSSIADNSWLADYSSKLDPKNFELVTWGSKDNPAFSDDEWEQLKREIDPTIFRRRYEAKLEFATGKVYNGFDFSKHKISQLPSLEVIEKAFIGIDWGYVDPTAIILILLSSTKVFYVMKEFVVEGAPLDMVVMAINKMRAWVKEEFNLPVTIYADPANKQYLETVKLKIKHDIHPGERDIFDGTNTVRNLIFQNRFYVFDECPTVLKELRLYRYIEKGWERQEKPEDKNNHTLDAIRYVLATYPLANVKYKPKEEVEELSPFWLRRTKAYKDEVAQSEGGLLGGMNKNQLWMP